MTTGATRDAPRPPIWASALVIARASAVVAVGVIPAFMAGALALQMGREFELPPVTLGLLIGLFFGCSAIASWPAGRLVERIGEDAGMRLSTFGAAICLLGIGVAGKDAVSVAGFLIVGGLANGLANPAANLLLVGAIPAHRQALALGMKQAAIPGATLLAGLSLPLLALTLGWRWAFTAAAIAALFLAFTKRPHGAARHAVRIRVASAEHLGAGRPTSPATATSAGPLNMVLLAGAATLGIWGGQSMGAYLVSYAVDSGVSEAGAGLVLTMASLSGIAARIGAGFLVDRARSNGVRELAVMLGIGALSLLLLASRIPALVWLAPISAFAGGWGWNGVLTYVVVRANPHAPAAATGITQTGVFVGATIGVPLFGVIAQASSYGTAWVATALSALAAALIVAFVGRRLPSGPVTEGGLIVGERSVSGR